MATGFTFGLAKSTSAGGMTTFSFGSPAFSAPGSGSTTTTSASPCTFPYSTTPTVLGDSTSSFGFVSSTSNSVVTTNPPSTATQMMSTPFTFGLPTITTCSATTALPLATPSGFSFGSPSSTSVASSATALSPSTATLGGFSFGIQASKPSTGGGLGQSTAPSATFADSATTAGLGVQSQANVTGASTLSSLFAMSNTPLSFGTTSPLQLTAPSTTTASASPFKLLTTISTTLITQPQPTSASIGVSQSEAVTSSIPQSTATSLGFTFSTTTGAIQGSQVGTGLSLSKPIVPTTELVAANTTTTSTTTTASTFPLFSTTPGTTFGASATAGTTLLASTSTLSSTVTLQSSTIAPSLAKSTTLTYHQLEELVNKWSHELEEQERYFMDEADRITEWDRTLLSNAEKIFTLYEKVDACKNEQTRLEQELDFIDGQQRELEQLLEPLERAATELPPGHLHADFEREAIFHLATNVDLELGQLLSDMREMAEQLNSTTSRFSSVIDSPVKTSNQANQNVRSLKGSKNPICSVDQLGALEQVTRILNCHMHSLKWIHQNTQELMERTKALEGS